MNVRVASITFDDTVKRATVRFSGPFGAASITEWEMDLHFPFQISESSDFREDQLRATKEAMEIVRSLSERGL